MSHAISLDSLLNLPAMGLPIVNYSPESTWEFGAAAQGYFRLPNQERTSILQVDGTYSLKNQWYINVQGNLYFGGETPWLLNFRAGYSDRPATYYGIGNTGNTEIGMLRKGSTYIQQRGYLNIQAPISINHNWSIGPMADMLITQYDTTDYQSHIPVINPLLLSQFGLGIVAQYDTRDVTFYPNKGIFFKTSLTQHFTFSPHSYITAFSADLRQYIPLPKKIVIAWQFKTYCLLSPDKIPYPILPRLGGQDGLRGIHSDMFRDDIMISVQAEVRLPIWSILRATVFAGIGDVYDFHDWHWATPKIGYGLGLRATINKAKVNLRFDIARSNVDPRWNNINAYSFYLTATEAF